MLTALIEPVRRIAAAADARAIVETTRGEAAALLEGDATIADATAGAPLGGSILAVLTVPIEPQGADASLLRVVRPAPFSDDERAAAALLAETAARALERAHLVSEARVREAERSRLVDQLLSAEQGERRRLALFLHDTSVQSLSAIAMMLDAAAGALDDGRPDDARTVLRSALERHRATIGALRDLSFNLEPVVLRDQGFAPAVAALAEQLGVEQALRIDVDVAAAETLGPNAQAALYQIIREALHSAIRRGPPTHVRVRVEHADRGVETVIEDDAPAERRRATLDALAERARSMSGTLSVDRHDDGTTVRVSLPPYAGQA